LLSWHYAVLSRPALVVSETDKFSFSNFSIVFFVANNHRFVVACGYANKVSAILYSTVLVLLGEKNGTLQEDSSTF